MRVVLDSNIVLSALRFPHGRPSWIQTLCTAGSILPLVCGATVRELIDAVGAPKFRLSQRDIQAFLAAYLPFTEVVETPGRIASVPRCSDPHDQVFVGLAAIGQAQVLVTGDRALLALSAPLPFAIESAAAFRTRVT